MNRATLHTTIGCAAAFAVGAAFAHFRSTSPSHVTARAASVPAAEARALDPALAKALHDGTGEERWLSLLAAAENATARDMPALLRAAGDEFRIVSTIATRWAELDPKDMLSSLYAEYTLPEDSPVALPRRRDLLHALVDEWARHNPAVLVRALSDVPWFAGLADARERAANAVVKTDLEAGLHAFKDWNIQGYNLDLKNVAAWAARDPAKAAEALSGFPDAQTAVRALQEIGRAWAKTDIEGGLRFAATLKGSERSAFAGEIVAAWASKDPDAAAKFAESQPRGAFRSQLGTRLAAAWAGTDPAAALAWTAQNLDGTTRVTAIADVAKAAAEKDIQKAAGLIAGMEPGEARDGASASIFEAWFKKPEQRDAAFAWLAQLDSEGARRAAIDRISWDWSWRDPAAAKEFLSGPYANLATSNIVQMVARNEAQKNPEVAMAWAVSLPESQRDIARKAALIEWVQKRPDAAFDQIRNLPQGSFRDSMVQQVTMDLAYRSPTRASEWLRSLGDTEREKAADELQKLPPEIRKSVEDAMRKR